MAQRGVQRYGITLITLHWLVLLLIVAVYACIELRGLFPRGSAGRDVLKTWHFMLGLSVFVLVWVRLAVRLTSPRPPIEPPPPRWQVYGAHLVGLALYLFMIAQPLLGWLTLSAAGKDIPFFGLQLAPLVAPDKELAGRCKDLHEQVGVIGYYLIGLHALAALFHHYVLRDNAFRRMLP